MLLVLPVVFITGDWFSAQTLRRCQQSILYSVYGYARTLWRCGLEEGAAELKGPQSCPLFHFPWPGLGPNPDVVIFFFLFIYLFFY